MRSRFFDEGSGLSLDLLTELANNEGERVPLWKEHNLKKYGE